MILQIQFSGATADTANSITNYINNNGYDFAYGSPISDGPVHYHSISEKTDTTYEYAVNYTFDVPAGGGIQLLRQTLSAPPQPPASNFTIQIFPGTDLTIPPG